MKKHWLRNSLIGIAALALLLVLTAGWFLSKGKTLGPRHTDFSEAAFDYQNSSFEDYIAYSQAVIQAARLDKPSVDVISNLSPFILEPAASCPRAEDGRYKKGILLIHGLIDSPYSMKPFGDFLQSQCFYVLGLLLPDHGTRPGDFLSTTWQRWAQATHFATEQLSQRAEMVVVSGHSAGGALAILEGETNTEVDSLILFAPALAVASAAQYAPYITWLGHLFPKAAWFEVEPDDALYRYESFPFVGAAETWRLIQATTSAMNERVRQLPIFTVATMQDNTVRTDAIIDFMAENTASLSKTLLFTQYPYPAAARQNVMPSTAREQGVLSVSHLGLMTPPTHVYYGLNGLYRNCGHYLPVENPDYVRCKNGERSWYGEVTADNLQQGVVERIAFNPYYDAMLGEILGFLKTLDVDYNNTQH